MFAFWGRNEHSASDRGGFSRATSARYVRGDCFRRLCSWHAVPPILTDPVVPRPLPPSGKAFPSPRSPRNLQDLQLAGKAERTQESYLRAVRKFAQWLNKSPDQASENDLRRYLLFIKNDQQWEGNSLKVAYSGLKFFYCHTCPREWASLTKLRVPKQLKLPTVLTIPEVDQLFQGHKAKQWLQTQLDRLLPCDYKAVGDGRHALATWPRMSTGWRSATGG